jgi:hypothetical protein
MKTKAVLVAVLMTACCATASAARADDAFFGAVLGGSAGAVVGHSMGGRDGAIVGGVLGAAAGAAIVDQRGPRTSYPGPVIDQRRSAVVDPVSVYYPRGEWGGDERRGHEWDHERWERRHWEHERREHGWWEPRRWEHERWEHESERRPRCDEHEIRWQR